MPEPGSLPALERGGSLWVGSTPGAGQETHLSGRKEEEFTIEAGSYFKREGIRIRQDAKK